MVNIDHWRPSDVNFVCTGFCVRDARGSRCTGHARIPTPARVFSCRLFVIQYCLSDSNHGCLTVCALVPTAIRTYPTQSSLGVPSSRLWPPSTSLRFPDERRTAAVDGSTDQYAVACLQADHIRKPLMYIQHMSCAQAVLRACSIRPWWWS